MRGSAARSIVGLLALVVLAGTAGTTLGQEENRSPAGGHAEVIAHGVIAMPGDELTWRLYDGSAGPREDAEAFETEWPGFLLGDEEPILVDVDGDVSLVSTGKATLVRQEAELTVAGLGDDDSTDYGWLTLTEATLDEEEGLELASDAFDAPSGDRQVDLVRDVLEEGEETGLPERDAPIFVYVVAGELDVTADDEEAETLGEGDGLLVDGELTLEAREDETVVLAAVIGDRVPAEEAPTPTPAPTEEPAEEATGSIEFTVQTCAPGITVETISEGACPFSGPDEELQLLTFEGTELIETRTFDDTEVGQTGFVWTGLELRTHVLQVFATGGESVYVEETEQVVLIPGPQYEITLTEDEPSALAPIFRLTEEIPEEDVSTVTVTFLGCEAGQDPEFFLPENCVETIEGSAALANDETGFFLGPDQAEVNDDLSLTFTYLGYDAFTVVDVVVPEAYVSFALSEETVTTDEDAPEAFVYVYAFLPLEE